MLVGKGVGLSETSNIIFSELPLGKKMAYGAGVVFCSLLSLPIAVAFVVLGVVAAAFAALAALAVSPFCAGLSGRLRHFAIGFLGEGVSLAVGTILYWIPMSWFDPTGVTNDQKTQIPVLLVHGYLHNSSAWTIFKRQLLAHNPNRLVFTIDLGANPIGKSVEGVYLDKVAAKIDAIRALTNSQQIHLVGHSLGGVVCSLYACKRAQKAGITVKSVVTIGSPLKGTPMARIAIGKCEQEMRDDSLLMRGNAQQLSLADLIAEKRKDLLFCHIGSDVDVIVPNSSALLANASGLTPNRIKFSTLGHMALLYSSTVAQKIIEQFRLAELGQYTHSN